MFKKIYNQFDIRIMQNSEINWSLILTVIMIYNTIIMVNYTQYQEGNLWCLFFVGALALFKMGWCSSILRKWDLLTTDKKTN